MRNTAPPAVTHQPQESAVLKRILFTLAPIVISRIMKKRREGEQPRADKRRFDRNGR